ncbi:cardiolipin synthase [Arcanobacterium wilhelmae]|uniref:Cardiolipin synthase n=1 Tax=Arcanobacterium wilhelmae TaxID=1803177 RepID=A0ABT9NAH2_9ACTO|nr:phospholipase D-like domain-containing protein [Arcanobacterium wilhelmae]MDP9800401.1 cardiolipin synthase [Arcanobacterium wilhelmae]WFN89830.1 phospholipase D-like domain-containing protein [Arcanobacterium wilhelmae]
MGKFRTRAWPHIKKALQWTAIGAASAQVVAAASIIAIDSHRKKRNPPTGEFPHLPPRTVEVDGNEITVYTFGADLYADMLDAIRGANHTVYFESFIVKADEVGDAFKVELIAAAERGVKVNIILDTLGNLNQNPRFRYFPSHPNIDVIHFPLVRLGTLTGLAKDKGYDHRKLLIVDSNVAFIGGYNIGELYAHYWRDTHIRITGPQVWELENSFVDMWNVFRRRKAALPAPRVRHWSPAVRAVQNIPAYHSYPVRTLYMENIDRSSTNVWITMGYFIPDAGVLNSLTAAAKRGVDVRILIPQYSNHILADWVGRPHYSALLRAGVKIFLFEEAMVHAKTMTVDGVWSTVGTTNIDALSMNGNYEVNVEIYSREFAKVMEDIFASDLTNAHELLPEVWEQRGALARAAENILGPLAPFY